MFERPPVIDRKLEHWTLCERLTVHQCSLLIIDLDPAKHSLHETLRIPPNGYSPISQALIQSIENKSLSGIHNANLDEFEISVSDLKKWLVEKSLLNNIFFENERGNHNFLNPENKFFAPKLATAFYAWKAVSSDPTLTKILTPKKAIDKWLQENAEEYDLLKDDANFSSTAIDEICNVANWKTDGGPMKMGKK